VDSGAIIVASENVVADDNPLAFLFPSVLVNTVVIGFKNEKKTIISTIYDYIYIIILC